MNQIIDRIKDDIDDVLKKHLTNIALTSDTLATKALCEIQQAIKRGKIALGAKSDFDIVEDIVCILEKYNIFTGGCHDF